MNPYTDEDHIANQLYYINTTNNNYKTKTVG